MPAAPKDDASSTNAPAARDAAAERELLYSLLGELPDRENAVSARTVSVEERDDCVLERLVLDLNGAEPVPACFLRPRSSVSPVPAVLYNHAHGGDYALGKEELLVGRKELWSQPYAADLVRRGFAVLTIDHWNFGERRGRTESEHFKELLWKGKVLWGLMVYDSLRAVDFLASRPEVNPRRIATIGMSMGSTMAWWLAALTEKVRVVVDICCLTDFHALIDRRGLDGHGVYYFVPGLLKYFTTARIQALICPRPHLSLAGNFDPLTPPEGLDRIDRQMRQIYGAARASRNWRLVRYNSGHVETAAMRAEALAFLDEHLGLKGR